MNFDFTEEQAAIQAMAVDFAAAEITPYTAEWDEKKHFPVDTLRHAGELGFGGI